MGEENFNLGEIWLMNSKNGLKVMKCNGIQEVREISESQGAHDADLTFQIPQSEKLSFSMDVNLSKEAIKWFRTNENRWRRRVRTMKRMKERLRRWKLKNAMHNHASHVSQIFRTGKEGDMAYKSTLLAIDKNQNGSR